MNGILDFFLEPYKAASALNITLEIIAAAFGVMSVVFAKRENILVYPIGIISRKCGCLEREQEDCGDKGDQCEETAPVNEVQGTDFHDNTPFFQVYPIILLTLSHIPYGRLSWKCKYYVKILASS